MTFEEFKTRLTPLELTLIDTYIKILQKNIISDMNLPFEDIRVLEIGSGWGLFSRSAMEADSQIKVWTIDKVQDPKDYADNTRGFEDRITRIIGDSKDKIFTLDKKFHFAFIDGDHGYDGTYADAHAAWEKLEVGGWMMFDDFLHLKNWAIPRSGRGFDYGITKAVWQFMKDKEIIGAQFFSVGNGLALIQKTK